MNEYPGLGLDHRYEEGLYPIGAHHGDYESRSELIYVRELAMMDVMEKLTDKPDWHKKVFDENIVLKWRKEALAVPDKDWYSLATAGKTQYWSRDGKELTVRDDNVDEMPDNIFNERAFDCCIQELQSKARYFEKIGIIPTMEGSASIAKSDVLVTEQLHEALRSAFDTLKSDQQASPDWHPNSNSMVQDLVHPSMYPLVYGRTRAFQEECVGVKNAISTWAGKGSVVPPEQKIYIEDENRWDYENIGNSIPSNFWSNTYQWLPANFAFQSDGSVKFTSYINNLHPDKYPDIYRTIEQLIEKSLPLWDQCLRCPEKEQVTGRMDPRMGLPDDPDDECETNWIPNNIEDCANVQVNEEDLEDIGYDPEDPEYLNYYKWQYIRKAKFPEPTWEEVDFAPKEGTRLIDQYRDSGLQVIVKMASIELTPEKPDFPVGSWHVEGQMNEHICGTALYYLDSDNITDSSLSFRMQTDSGGWDYRSKYHVGQGAYHWMESVFGTNLDGGASPCLQNYGSVQTRERRLLAFPNVFQHRVSPFSLIDPTKPGHRRFIALWLIDPTVRIISTANVPPQQLSWYTEALLGATPEARKEALAKLPAELIALLLEKGLGAQVEDTDVVAPENAKLPEELMEMVRQSFDRNTADSPMGIEEARHHRAKLMEERSQFVRTAEEGWQSHSYNFCEH